MSKILTQYEVDRPEIMKVLRKEGNWTKFKVIKAHTDLSRPRVMDVTNKAPYDIISSQFGYKLLKDATAADVELNRKFIRRYTRQLNKRVGEYTAGATDLGII